MKEALNLFGGYQRRQKKIFFDGKERGVEVSKSFRNKVRKSTKTGKHMPDLGNNCSSG